MLEKMTTIPALRRSFPTQRMIFGGPGQHLQSDQTVPHLMMLVSSPFVDKQRRASNLDRIRHKRSRLSVGHRLQMRFFEALRCKHRKEGRLCLTCRHKGSSQDLLDTAPHSPTRVHKYPPHSDVMYHARI
jgi:hypothetical protein